ncbi:MAG: hypothetical protein Q4B25_00125 [Pseudomonadota bacterium]|nr:hypothetical protein [Pseudomonadota bacterium]
MFIRIVMLPVFITVIFSSGCAKVGSTAGKAQAKIERKVHAVKDGYHRGYSEEKAKTKRR